MQYLDAFSIDYVNRTPRSGIVTPSDIPYLKRLYAFNRDQIQNYYQTRNFAVKNTHIISRILEHFPLHLGVDSYRYLEQSLDKTKYLVKHFKFTSELERGQVHPGYFFGNEGEEIIIANYDHFDINSATLNWRTIAPISVVTTNRNDSKLLLPLGNSDGSKSGLSVISINIPMLALKYREFLKEQYINSIGDSGMVLNKNHFITKYLINTMMPDCIDHALLNMVMDKFYGRETVTPTFKHRFKIFEPTVQLDRYTDQVVSVITSKKLDFVNLLRNIPLMFNENASQLLAFNDIAITRQMRWAIVVSRLPYMCFLLDVSKSETMNRHYINDWKRLMKRVRRDGDWVDQFSYEENSSIAEKINRIENA